MKTHLIFGCLTVLLLVLVIGQSRQKTVTFQDVINQAQSLAAAPYVPVPAIASKTLRQLNYDQYRDIRWRDEQTLWRRPGLPFQVKFFFTGGSHSLPVNLFQVNRDSARPLLFSPEFFDYGKNFIPKVDREAGGYAGFRIHYPINRPDYLDETAVFLGASYFRAVGKDQIYGLSARGVAVDCASPKNPEEFPSFTSFWLVQPKNLDRHLKIYALLDGPSVSGAYEMTLEPGVTTRMDIHAVLFFRKKVESLGLAPLTSMFWYGENTSNTFGGFRPEVHDSDGLLVHGTNDEWIWRPLSWSKDTQVNTFQANQPKGFGLLQRDRAFDHYQDLEANYHRRPSAWVEPHGDWGAGAVKLVQLSTTNEFMDNVVAFWEPTVPPNPGERREISYSLSWRADSPLPSGLGACVTTRIDYQDAQWYRVFVLDFAGGELAQIPPTTALTADVSVTEGGELGPVTVQKNANDNSWRVAFTVSTRKLKQSSELRCILKQADGKALTETWTHTWIAQ